MRKAKLGREGYVVYRDVYYSVSWLTPGRKYYAAPGKWSSDLADACLFKNKQLANVKIRHILNRTPSMFLTRERWIKRDGHIIKETNFGLKAEPLHTQYPESQLGENND